MGGGNAEPKFATADEIGRFSDQLIPEAAWLQIGRPLRPNLRGEVMMNAEGGMQNAEGEVPEGKQEGESLNVQRCLPSNLRELLF